MLDRLMFTIKKLEDLDESGNHYAEVRIVTDNGEIITMLDGDPEIFPDEPKRREHLITSVVPLAEWALEVWYPLIESDDTDYGNLYILTNREGYIYPHVHFIPREEYIEVTWKPYNDNFGGFVNTGSTKIDRESLGRELIELVYSAFEEKGWEVQEGQWLSDTWDKTKENSEVLMQMLWRREREDSKIYADLRS